MAVLEEIVALMNAYPPLWFLYVLVLVLPFVLVISCLFWPKDRDNVAYRKKTDAPSPDDKHKEEVRDSGIEASGEAEQDSVRELSPSTLGPVSQVNKKAESTEKSESAEKSEEGQSEPLQEKEQVSHHQNGGIAENLDVADAHSDTAIQNGMVEHMDSPEEIMENGEIEVEMEEDDEEDVEEMKRKRWSFPPILDEFDLMATEKDPTELEEIFSDERLKEIKLRIEDGGPGLGITIVGGTNSRNGDLPMLIKRIIPGSLADQEGSIKPGDELVAVNETLLAGVEKDYAAKALSGLEGDVRLLVLQDD